MITILLVEDHLLVREAWKESLSKIAPFKIIGEADSITEAYNKTLQLRPDVILCDINLRRENGADLISKIVNTVPNPKIIVVSMNDEYSFIKKMFSIGAKGYVTKFSPQADLIEAIRQVHNGETYVCSGVRKLFLEKAIHSANDENLTLSLRELDIIKLVSQGKGNKDIATQLGLGIKTVEAHKTSIYKKLGLKSIAELISYGKAKGLDF